MTKGSNHTIERTPINNGLAVSSKIRNSIAKPDIDLPIFSVNCAANKIIKVAFVSTSLIDGLAP